MDTTSFVIQSSIGPAEIRPCCGENNIVDYAVWLDNKLAFTVTKSQEDPSHWVVALQNADDVIDDALVQQIGEQINQQYGQSN